MRVLIWAANGVLRLLARVTGHGRTIGLDEAWYSFSNLQVLRMNVKNFGYQMAREHAPGLARIDTAGEPKQRNLVSKPTTQADVESPWFVYWCGELHAAPIYHRKLWEFAFSLQSLFDAGMLREGARGIGFGCGEEPLASYFATKGMNVTVTDLAPEKVAGLGWAESSQHAKTIERAFHGHIVAREIFDRHVRHAFVDMNDIPAFEEKFDFCWSICALEHLGSIANGLAFIENSLRVLKPGGIAVHTTEFNCLADRHTIDRGPTVLFQRAHFEELARRLAASGHRLLGPDFDVGNGPIDRYIDMPPYFIDERWLSQAAWGGDNQSAHLKLSIDGFPCTCFGIVVRKAEA